GRVGEEGAGAAANQREEVQRPLTGAPRTALRRRFVDPVDDDSRRAGGQVYGGGGERDGSAKRERTHRGQKQRRRTDRGQDPQRVLRFWRSGRRLAQEQLAAVGKRQLAPDRLVGAVLRHEAGDDDLHSGKQRV